MSQIVNDRPPVTYHKKTFFQRLALDFRQNKMVYLMWLPVLAFYLIFHYAPMGGLVIAFQNYKPFKGIAKSKFVGLEHFQEFLTGTYAWRTIRNTLVISLLQILIGFPMPIIFALLINEVRCNPYKRVVQTVSYIRFIHANYAPIRETWLPYCRESQRGYYAAVTAMDANVGRILDRLEADGLLDSTMIVFTSDNGSNMGHHGIVGKGNGTYPMNMYETSVKVPGIFAWPGHIPQGVVSQTMVSHYDFMPSREIFERGSTALSELTWAAERYFPGDFDVVMSGGIFAAFPEYAQSVTAKASPRARMIRADVPPVFGCALEAVLRGGAVPAPDFRTRFMAEYAHAAK